VKTELHRVLVAFVAFVLTCALSSSTVRAEEQVDNPQYQGWSKFAAGTAVKYTQTVEAMGQKQDVQVTMTLVSISPEKATIETKATITVQGQTQETPAQKMDIPAKVNKSEAMEVGQPAPNIKAEVKQGEEKVEAAGKTYDCKWTEVKSTQQGTDVVAKTWLSDDVPGRLVKMEATTSGAMASSTKMTLAGMEKK
jgi:hypothetical protein